MLRASAFRTLLFRVRACGVALLIVSGWIPSASAQSSLDSRLSGEWQIENGATYTITAVDDTYEIDIVDWDGEVFEVESVTWADGVLSWTYYVPSSDARVSEVTTRISENEIEVEWENSAGNSGTDLLVLVE